MYSIRLVQVEVLPCLCTRVHVWLSEAAPSQAKGASKMPVGICVQVGDNKPRSFHSVPFPDVSPYLRGAGSKDATQDGIHSPIPTSIKKWQNESTEEDLLKDTLWVRKHIQEILHVAKRNGTLLVCLAPAEIIFEIGEYKIVGLLNQIVAVTPEGDRWPAKFHNVEVVPCFALFHKETGESLRIQKYNRYIEFCKTLRDDIQRSEEVKQKDCDDDLINGVISELAGLLHSSDPPCPAGFISNPRGPPGKSTGGTIASAAMILLAVWTPTLRSAIVDSYSLGPLDLNSSLPQLCEQETLLPMRLMAFVKAYPGDSHYYSILSDQLAKCQETEIVASQLLMKTEPATPP